MYSWYRMDCTNPKNITNPVQSPCFKPVAVMASPCFSPSSERLCDSWSTRPSAVNKSWIPSCKASWALPSQGWKTLENDERKKTRANRHPFLKPTKQDDKRLLQSEQLRRSKTLALVKAETWMLWPLNKQIWMVSSIKGSQNGQETTAVASDQMDFNNF